MEGQGDWKPGPEEALDVSLYKCFIEEGSQEKGDGGGEGRAKEGAEQEWV